MESKDETIARLTAERDTARAETAALIERAAVLCDGTAKYHMSDPDDIDVVGLTAREIRTLTPADATAALAARDKATRKQALREAAAVCNKNAHVSGWASREAILLLIEPEGK